MNARMKTILFISHSGYNGGAQTVLKELVSSLSEKNLFKKIFFIYPKSHGVSLFKFFKTYRVFVDRIYFFVSPPKLLFQSLIFILNIPAFFYLGIYIMIKRVNIVYINSSVNLMPLVLSSLLRKKIIFHIHESTNDLVRVTPTYTNWLYKSLLFRANIHTIFVSHNSKNLWEKDLNVNFNSKNYSVIYSPIKQLDIVDSSNNNNDKLTFGFLGTISALKNIEIILYALAQLKKEQVGVEFSFIICGEGNNIFNLKKLAHQLEINNFVFFESPSNNVSIFFSKIDVLIQPSLNESWGLVAIESMISKKPVIMTNRSGLTDIFEDNIHCLYFDATDAGDLFSKIKLIISENVRQKLVTTAYEKVISYNFSDLFYEKVTKLITS
jgi:glycosyltransferase involved in cell wall biosynthesis